MRISALFEKLYSGEHITISFASPSHFTSFYSQLRTSKSRYERKFQLLFGESLTVGQVVRAEPVENVVDLTYKFYMGLPLERSKIEFIILSSTPTTQGNVGEQK